MKPWSLFHPLVLMDAMGAPDPVVNQALCLAARDFCDHTNAWTEWLDPVTPTPLSNLYDFDVPTSQELVRVVRAVSGADDWDVLPYAGVPADWPDIASVKLTDTVVHFEDNSYLVYPNTKAVRLQLSWKPALSATSCGDALFDRYAEAIADGAKSRLLMIKSADFYDPQLAALKLGKFNQAMHAAANLGWRQRSQSERRTKKAGM